MPTIGQCEREIKKLKKHVVDLNKLKQGRHELTSMLKEAPLLFGEYTGNICPYLMEAVQKIDERIALMEDLLFMVGEAPESQVNQRLQKEKPKHEFDNRAYLVSGLSKEELAILKEGWEKNPEYNYMLVHGEGRYMFRQEEGRPILHCIPDLLKEHGL